MDGFLVALAVSFGVVFVAELGDKSQLMALAFATRYRALPVLVGITLATTAVHLLSVAVGHGLGSALPTGWIALVASVAFLGFGGWTLRGDRLTAAERAKAERATGSAVLTASVAFFLAELGDKTMLATITLATQHGWFGVWVGSTLGMVAADALAILVGRKLGRLLPERTVKVGAAVLFFVFGTWLALDAVQQLTGRSAWAAVAEVLDHHAAGWLALLLGAVVAVLGVVGGRRLLHASPARRAMGRAARVRGSAAWWARVLYGAATVLGLVAPLLVAADVVDPIALFDAPGVVVIGAALALLGVALVLASQLELRPTGGGADPVLARRGLRSRVRNPGLLGAVVATAGTLVMVPTLVAVLAAVLLVVSAQVQVRAVREPMLVELHGERYLAYAARTGRFLPRLTPERPRTRVG
ncbi:TMEM165/GDT1 family protein [Pseudonocardia kunmingensis]|uniref:Putative Ca2+/H+ antiporter (TMEM165/GDT1 family) n=1 Tax=Pseudonocardia kunmingensis TaxID=630975 RepID=A0A543DLK4_9PSEU|nr:TMEM165/GDT1 family protein [Pseudonocardia kunmingensis]TQM10172.1 putative Ca2+/H+ antiporter (TMEM165/GDT1 family) [Pseudonocardia kunmingensis]